MQLAPGLHRLGTDRVNVYLLADGSEVTIIDAGLPAYWAGLPAELEAMGRNLDDVRAIVLTHGHSDHIGFAERARRERGLTPRIHAADAELAQGGPGERGAIGPMSVGSLVPFLWFLLRKGGMRIPDIGEVTTYGDGDTLDVPGSPRVILTPGHTPGSASLHVPMVDALFVGDAMSTMAMDGSTGPMISPFTVDRDVARQSLDRIRDVDASWMLPGHGVPWSDGVGAAVDLAVKRAAG
jgi:glyoxylase-like metal-dependent hydrolase (beta-lactamase superfamily II)